MDDVTIRPVTADDVPAVVSLVSRVLAEFGLTFGAGSETDAQLHALPASYARDGGGFWVAVAPDGTLLGTAGVAPVAPGDVELRKMYLEPAARGRGLAKRLLAVAVAHARARGARRMVLDTTEQMTDAQRFYESHGFVRDDAQVRGSRCHRGYALAL